MDMWSDLLQALSLPQGLASYQGAHGRTGLIEGHKPGAQLVTEALRHNPYDDRWAASIQAPSS